MRGGEGGGAGVGAAGILEGRQATSFAAYRFIPAGFETATWRIGSRKKTSGSTASNFQAMLRPLTCFLTMRTMVTIRSRKVTMLMAQPYMPAAWAAEFTSSQSVPAQMSEPWHVLKPARQAGRRGQVQAARIDGCSRAGVIDGCRVIDGVSALLTSLPLRYAAVVPEQNILASLTPGDGQMTGKMTTWTRRRTM